MPKPKNLKLNAYEVPEKQPRFKTQSTINIICDIILREYLRILMSSRVTLDSSQHSDVEYT